MAKKSTRLIKLPAKRQPKPHVVVGPAAKPMAPAEEETGLIQGTKPDSKNEWYFYLALEKLKNDFMFDYTYQYKLGMWRTRGSQSIDFLIYYAGREIACYIQGEYWHREARQTEDQLKQAAAKQEFGEGNVITFSEEETESSQAAKLSIRKKVFGG